MKIKEISPKVIDYVKRGVCTVLTAILLFIPHGGKGETKVESSIGNETKVIQEYQNVITVDENNLEQFKDELRDLLAYTDVSERPTFIFTTHWVRSSNYEVDKGYKKDNREYMRKVYKFTVNEKFNPEYFDEDIEKIALFFRDNENALEIFDIVEKQVETVNLTKEEEKSINTKEDMISIDGTNLTFKFLSRDESKRIEEKKNSSERKSIILGCSMILSVIIIMIIRYKKYGIMGLK